MISCLVATYEGKWGVYYTTNEQLERKEQPAYLAPYDYPSQVWKALDTLLAEGESNGHTWYSDFWQHVRDAGIEVPETDKLPHRQKVKQEVESANV